MLWFQTFVNWIRMVRQRYIVRFFAAILAAVVSLYSVLFYLLMPVYEDQQVSFWESFYWTISRLTTTGELAPSVTYSSVPIQALSMLVQVSGLGFVFAAFPLAIIPALEQRIRGVPKAIYPQASDHIVICGYNDIVESLIDELVCGPCAVRVVDNDMETVRGLQQKKIPAIYADPTDEQALDRAGAKTARYIIANRENEEDNAKIVLAARGMSDAKIVAVIDNLGHANYFRYAGASEVLSPKKILGIHLAQKATASWKDELFGANELVTDHFIVELPIYPGSPFDGLTLRESQIPERSGATLIGIWHRGNLELEPGPGSLISAENVLVAVGHRDQLLELQVLTRTLAVPEISEKRHCVIAGFGDVGQAIKEILDAQGVNSVIIDPREKTGDYIRGDATNEDILLEANIKTAASFFVAGHIDRDNIFSTLVARKLNPDLHILARANSRDLIDKLYRAGADFVFSLSAIAAQMLAGMLIGNNVVTLAEGLKVLSTPIGPAAVGKTIGQARIRTLTGCTVVAASGSDGTFTANPGPRYVLESGATLVILGNAQQVAEFKKRFRQE